MKQTAVEFLVEQLNNGEFLDEELIQQAKELEKEQIIDAWLSAWKDSFLEPLEDKYYQPQAEQYYNEQFKNK
jgi:hypothetical protein